MLEGRNARVLIRDIFIEKCEFKKKSREFNAKKLE